MRSFDDSDGHHWQAALMEASFGNVIAVFSRIGDDAVLRRSMETANLPEAEQHLATASDAELLAMLAEAQPWH